MTTQMSDRRGTMYGEDTRTVDVLSTSSLNVTALNTESALTIKERPRAWLHIEHHKKTEVDMRTHSRDKPKGGLTQNE